MATWNGEATDMNMEQLNIIHFFHLSSSKYNEFWLSKRFVNDMLGRLHYLEGCIEFNGILLLYSVILFMI